MRQRTRLIPLGVAALALWGGTSAPAQVTPPEPSLAPPTPPTPSAAVPPSAAAPVSLSREAELEQRVRQLETMVQQLSNRVAAAPAAGSATTGSQPGTASRDTGTAATTAAPSSSGGVAAPGQSLPPNPPPSARFNSPATLESKKVNAKFGPGFEFRSDDDEFILQFHNLTQFDYRGFEQGGQSTVRDTFSIPRQWFMFSGRMTKPFGYFVSFANGFDTFSLLDVFIDVDYDPRLRARVGRFKTPFTYEFLVEPIQGLIIPERSLFFNNFGQNRDLGAMAFGRVLDNKLDYAAGVFNGSRNGFLDQNNAKHVSAFLNWKPFNDEHDTLVENLNVGGSVYAGDTANNLPTPQTLRTAVATSGNPIIGIPFLSFNNHIRETGFQAFWDLHMAYYYRQLAVIGEWGSGSQGYAPSGQPRQRTRLPVDSFYVQAGYLLTGETRSSVGIVKPNRPFDLRKGKFGPGAWELTGRYNYLQVGQQVFSAGLADPNLWSSSVSMTDLGLNWHVNQYVKVYFDWQHAAFGQPVVFAPGRRQLTSDMFLVRLQLYF